MKNKNLEVNLEYADALGHFGQFGGSYIPEILVATVQELDKAYRKYKNNSKFKKEYAYYLKQYVGRPTPLYFAEHFTEKLKGPQIYLKREDLNHTGAHKINNTIGQILLAVRMGKKHIIAETGAGQHGVATATVAANFGLKCTVFMGEKDIQRQSLNVFKMRLLGAEVRPVASGSKTLKDATNETIRYWMGHPEAFYIIGSVVGPHPYPSMVRDFQAVIGKEARAQIKKATGSLPHALVACVGGGSNAIGLFQAFIKDTRVALYGVEAAGLGVTTTQHAATLSKGSVGVLHGAKSYLLQDADGQIMEAHSISAGLDYPGVGPQHSLLKDTGRVQYAAITDAEALRALELLSLSEGIIPALESSHALAYAIKLAKKMKKNQVMIVNVSGRGDKDINTIAAAKGVVL